MKLVLQQRCDDQFVRADLCGQSPQSSCIDIRGSADRQLVSKLLGEFLLQPHRHSRVDRVARLQVAKTNRFEHAVKTTDVTAIRNTDPKIRVNAAERVDEWFCDAHVIHTVVDLAGPSTCPSGSPR